MRFPPATSLTYKIIISLCAGLLALLVADRAAVHADVVIDLEKATQHQVPIAVQGFYPIAGGAENIQLSHEGRDELEADLRLSELFLVLDRKKFFTLEMQDVGRSSIDYGAWNGIKTRWLIKTAYSVEPGGSVKMVFRLFDVVNKQFLMGKQYYGTAANQRRMIHRFADEVVALLGNGIRGIAETRIAYVAQDGWKKEIFTIDFDGRNVERVTVDDSIAVAPAWSPNGQSILYTSYADRNPDLFSIDLASKSRRAMLTIPGINTSAAWSPDGERIAVTLGRDKNAEVYVFDRATGLNRLTHHFNIDTSPTWSPDGTRIAFTSDRSGTAEPQIYVMDAATGDKGELKRISFDSHYNDDPAWSPDGDRIAYTARVGRVFRIRLYDFATGRTADLNAAPGSQENPAWSPDGRFIAYVQRGESGQPQIFVQRVGGGKPRQLTFMKGGAHSPAWSPFPFGKVPPTPSMAQVAETPTGP